MILLTFWRQEEAVEEMSQDSCPKGWWGGTKTVPSANLTQKVVSVSESFQKHGFAINLVIWIQSR